MGATAGAAHGPGCPRTGPAGRACGWTSLPALTVAGRTDAGCPRARPGGPRRPCRRRRGRRSEGLRRSSPAGRACCRRTYGSTAIERCPPGLRRALRGAVAPLRLPRDATPSEGRTRCAGTRCWPTPDRSTSTALNEASAPLVGRARLRRLLPAARGRDDRTDAARALLDPHRRRHGRGDRARRRVLPLDGPVARWARCSRSARAYVLPAGPLRCSRAAYGSPPSRSPRPTG